MKKLVLVIVITLVIIALLFSYKTEVTEEEKAAIKQAALDYIEGWYEGDGVRMEQALHTDLNKKGLQVHPKTGKVLISHASFSNMVSYARSGFGKNEEKKKEVKVFILDVHKNMASVKTVSPDFIDYLHVAKIEGRWKILNVLWEPNK